MANFRTTRMIAAATVVAACSIAAPAAANAGPTTDRHVTGPAAQTEGTTTVRCPKGCTITIEVPPDRPQPDPDHRPQP